MAHNYPQQPYYGLPFQYPPQPQQMQQQMPQHPPLAPPEAHGGPPAMQQQHAPDPHAFYLPGLQPPPAPNANHASYNQNAQQPPFPQTWPPPDPNAWFALMHSAALSGQPPPPLPGFGLPPQHFPQAPPLPATPADFPPPHPQHQIAASDRIQEVMDSDREDGEVSDGEIAARPQAGQGGARGFQEPPRSVPQVQKTSPRAEEGYNPDRPAAGQTVAKRVVPKAPQQPAPPVDPLVQMREEAKQFIKLLHSNNVGYRSLANEAIDQEQLRGLYQSLNLPSEPAPILPPKSAPAQPANFAVQPVSQSNEEQPKPAPTIKTSVAAVPPKSAPSPVDRKDYIARLQAAKLAKLSGAAKPSPPQTSPPAPAIAAAVAPVAPAANTPQAATTPTTKPPITEEQRARTTELIKQRLEALKAKTQNTPGQNGTASAPASAQKEQVPSADATQIPLNGNSSTRQPNSLPFPGIPGLFMNPPPSFDISGSKPSASIPQKRPAPSDSTGHSTPRGSVTPYTRPLGDSPHGYDDEPMIIEVSDDESNGSDMDIDDEDVPSQPVKTSLATKQQRQLPGSLPSFPSRPTSALPDSSAISTPGSQTPNTEAREQELKKKQDELAVMKARLQKKLAEKREKDREAAAAALALQRDISNGASDLIQDVKRRRREEIESKLPAIDSELAANANRMTLLMKEMEELKVQNEKITKDKELLTQELEGLGIDTEGMSHAEMQAKKDEIEHQLSPERDVTPRRIESSAPITAPASEDDYQDQPVEEIQQTSAVEAAPVLAALENNNRVNQERASLPGLGSGSQTVVANAVPPSQAPTVDEVYDTKPVAALDKSQSTNAQEPPNAATVTIPSEMAIAPSNVSAAVDVQDSATPLDEDDDFYSPAPAAAPEVEQSMDVTVNAASAPSPSEEGEGEMSLSSEDEEEYEPEEPTVLENVPMQYAQVPHITATKSPATEDISTEEEEAYEPPDVGEVVANVEADGAGVDVEDGVPQVEADDGAMDIASSSSEDSDSDSSSDGEISEPANDATISESHALQDTANQADDLAPELQSETAPESIPVPEDEHEVPKFTPYESPLRMFKSYRYHPNFAQDVSGGFLSNTFSHQIDPEKPLCQYESAGGSCNDPDCPNQHFRGMSITGETLLVQLGTANPGKTPEEKQAWNDGLRGVLKELRKKSIKDPNGIAVEIAKYRRQFLNDDTRVVNL
ncbi:hypothetical protein FB567DRAFT_599694 [Paraphoma chrysanthemicola]|uniref:Putative zinc-finger domain-containing protein n=1 Tax=Paraphoma chrysanthemicola TaxID=798071 RepID=A0A8K0QSY5_9PLEO|nr:hypothetical protein FB567DRAFT_599694 [Paraphoma chrysanthemicola]